jgi:hypothetical protein
MKAGGLQSRHDEVPGEKDEMGTDSEEEQYGDDDCGSDGRDHQQGDHG